jgi:hypothetical protein
MIVSWTNLVYCFIALWLRVETYAPQFRDQANRRLEILVATLRAGQHY